MLLGEFAVKATSDVNNVLDLRANKRKKEYSS